MSTIERAGARIQYTRTGQGPVVLLIQGVGLEGGAWAPQVEALSQWFTVVHLDNRGIGGSTYRGSPLSIETMASDALAVMNAEGADRFHVVGHSMGGVIAQELAVRAPRRVASLALLCTFARGRDAMRLDRTMVWASVRSRIGTRSARRAAFLEMIVPEDVVRAVGADTMHERLATLFGRDLAEQPSIAMRQLRALSRYDAGALLGRLEGIPTLVLSGERDRIAAPASGRALAAAIPGATYLELPGAGHAVPAYQPDVVNSTLLRHLLAAEEQPPELRVRAPKAKGRTRPPEALVRRHRRILLAHRGSRRLAPYALTHPSEERRSDVA